MSSQDQITIKPPNLAMMYIIESMQGEVAEDRIKKFEQLAIKNPEQVTKISKKDLPKSIKEDVDTVELYNKKCVDFLNLKERNVVGKIICTASRHPIIFSVLVVSGILSALLIYTYTAYNLFLIPACIFICSLIYFIVCIFPEAPIRPNIDIEKLNTKLNELQDLSNKGARIGSTWLLGDDGKMNLPQFLKMHSSSIREHVRRMGLEINNILNFHLKAKSLADIDQTPISVASLQKSETFYFHAATAIVFGYLKSIYTHKMENMEAIQDFKHHAYIFNKDQIITLKKFHPKFQEKVENLILSLEPDISNDDLAKKVNLANILIKICFGYTSSRCFVPFETMEESEQFTNKLERAREHVESLYI